MQSVRIDPQTPLLYALRNNLELNGPKYGCGEGYCGSCMVLMNGKAVTSCRITCAQAGKAEIITLEGLRTAGGLHPVQQAFIDKQAAQCGYCLNGMVITAAALYQQNKKPSDTQIKAAMQPVLCRCGTYGRVMEAIKSLT